VTTTARPTGRPRKPQALSIPKDDAIPTAASNLAFDADLKARDPAWGLRRVADFAAAARGTFELVETRAMPANNLMLLLRRI